MILSGSSSFKAMKSNSGMQDIQSQQDKRGLPLEMVGVRNVMLPLTIYSSAKKKQHASTSFNFYANLEHERKGHHMSRFIEILTANQKKSLTPTTLAKIAKKSKKILHATTSVIDATFTYYVVKKSPVSMKNSFDTCQITFSAKSTDEGETQSMTCCIPLMLLCPCSKAISKHNAHNQRALVTVTLTIRKDIPIEEIFSLVDTQGSSSVYPILKRVDEKYVTEVSYENPKFVEDTVRDIAIKLKKLKDIVSFSVECESFESIHSHNAYAKYQSV